MIDKIETEKKALDVKARIISVLLQGMIRKNVTYREIAKELGITQNNIKLLLSPSYPHINFIDFFRVCVFLNVGLTVRTGDKIHCRYTNKSKDNVGIHNSKHLQDDSNCS